MAAEDSGLEKTEPASPRRLEQAREEGQIARSVELSAFAVLASALSALWFFGDSAMGSLMQLVSHALSFEPAAAHDVGTMMQRFHDLSVDALVLGAPLMAVTVVAALAAPLALSGWSFAPKALQPKFSRISPLQGFKRMFSMRSLAELGKALLKATLIGGVAALVLWSARDALLGLAMQPINLALASLGGLVMMSVLTVSAAMIVIAGVDVPLQLWQHAKQLRMTREEVKREHKETEGDPHLKAAIRAQQRAAANKRMMADVPKADVIVTNPTHYAVALRYSEKMAAPTVIAKGVDLTAARIRGVADEHRVPVLEAPPLARALYAHTDIGQQIPEKLYTAVAEVLAYVFQLKSHGTAGLKPLGEVDVPAELDPKAAVK